MPARIVRRSFATPFVVTLAAACSSSPPPSPQPPVMNPPAPTDPTPTDPTPPTNPPTDPQSPPTTGIPPMNPPAPVQRGPWRVFKTKDGCQAVVQVECPKPEPGKPMHTCNPPPAHKYEPCPEGVSDTNSVTIVSWGADSCRLDVPMPSCPPKVHCNPPPPRRVPCPE